MSRTEKPHVGMVRVNEDSITFDFNEPDMPDATMSKATALSLGIQLVRACAAGFAFSRNYDNDNLVQLSVFDEERTVEEGIVLMEFKPGMKPVWRDILERAGIKPLEHGHSNFINNCEAQA